jgi:flavin reductase (DIM6/NTAB) family NADH-FMN oxidoreductase RutF
MSKKPLGAKNSLYPMPTVIVGAKVNGKPNFLTIAWCGIMGGAPPLISVALRKERFTSPGIKANKTFSVNLPPSNLVKETDYIGMMSGSKVDKSEIFKVFYGKLETAPMIEECHLCMECKLADVLDFGHTHEVFIGEIVEVYCDEDCMNGNVPDITKIDPIIYSTGDNNYWKVGEKIAKSFEVGAEYASLKSLNNKKARD